MGTPPANAVTRLLRRWSEGDQQALDELMPLVYDELRQVARQRLRHEHPGHTLQPTALVHEAYLKLVDQRRTRWQNRAHFFAVAAQLIRRILVDHARRHAASKRGGGAGALTLEATLEPAVERELSVVALDDTLSRLAALDPRQARLVELRFFGGLDVEETAEVLGISSATVKREWRTAKAWLHRELQGPT
jgi:RNA polymerase sigma factor (TIGR02999 family)